MRKHITFELIFVSLIFTGSAAGADSNSPLSPPECKKGWHKVGSPFPSDWCGFGLAKDPVILHSNFDGRCVSGKSDCEICVERNIASQLCPSLTPMPVPDQRVNDAYETEAAH
jgi:hypothetical protein